MTNSERRISRQRAALPPPGEARPDWWIVCEVAKRLGFGDAFAYPNAAAIFREHAALSAFENDGARGFDIGALADLSDAEFNALAPTQWPMRKGAVAGEKRLFADGGFVTPDRKARFVSIAPPALALRTSDAHPLRLNTGRVRDQWHTMTRTGRSPRLAAHRSEPYLALHPLDAADRDLREGDLAKVSSAYGEALLKVTLDDGQRRGETFAPIHWTGETSSDGRIGALVQSNVDPFSGQPELKATPVQAAPVAITSRGFLLSRRPLSLPPGVWWSRQAIVGGHGYRLALREAEFLRIDDLRSILPSGDRAEYVDAKRGVQRFATFEDDRLAAMLFLAPSPAEAMWDAALALFARDFVTGEERRLLLSGAMIDGCSSGGPVICACHGVGLADIEAAIARGEATDVATIGVRVKAGTNCGSCIPELKKILKARRNHEPAHAA